MQALRLQVANRSGKPRTPGGRRRFVVPAAVALLISALPALGPPPARAESDQNSEAMVKLAFLYKTAEFVQWPPEALPSPAAPLIVCMAGQDPFAGETRELLRGRTAAGHPIQMKRLKPGEDPKACHIIFIPAGDNRIAARILAAIKGASILSIGESKGFADLGGIINLALEGNRLRFEINLDAAAQTRLRISSKLLSLAKIVKGEANP